MIEKKQDISYNVYKYDFEGISIHMRCTVFVNNELQCHDDGKLWWTNSQEVRHVPSGYIKYLHK